ncbi:hypothetical protein [Methanosarcina horonobensis]|uniref:hypothetical protein n=1 Tax=Methanosarcina horonobensis TaxID=418008 RepID=UPI0022B8645F|nr:hypothetical protein [Methanosarcina horonobensis]
METIGPEYLTGESRTCRTAARYGIFDYIFFKSVGRKLKEKSSKMEKSLLFIAVLLENYRKNIINVIFLFG